MVVFLLFTTMNPFSSPDGNSEEEIRARAEGLSSLTSQQKEMYIDLMRTRLGEQRPEHREMVHKFELLGRGFDEEVVSEFLHIRTIPPEERTAVQRDVILRLAVLCRMFSDDSQALMLIERHPELRERFEAFANEYQVFPCMLSRMPKEEKNRLDSLLANAWTLLNELRSEEGQK